jgi:eukaryotic-like serine/threonine-protein kinase
MRRAVAARRSSASRAEPVGFSSEFLASTRHRLGVMCMAVMFGVLMAQGQNHLFALVLGWDLELDLSLLRASQAALFVVAGLLYWVVRSDAVSTGLALNAGLSFEVIGGFLLSFPFSYRALSADINVSELHWVCIWLTMFPLVVPTRPAKTLLVSLITASMPPLIFALWALNHDATPTPRELAFAFAPNYFCALLALLPATLVYRLSVSLSEAQRSIERLGSYRLVRKLGSGGMGEVWEASHELLARPAAIKLIRPAHPGFVSEDRARRSLSRFAREAKVTAALSSPHTVSLFDYGTMKDGTFFYVMELLDGLDLEDFVDRYGPLPPNRVVHLLSQVCDSLAEAHRAGLVHRDVKPGNIFVCRSGLRHDFVKVFDFGLVFDKSAEDHEEEIRLTREGALVGTPGYIAPEVASHQQIDGRADIYSLGCVAFWLLTGGYAFEATSAIQMVIKQLSAEPEAPSERAAQEIPAALDELVLACLAKDPEERPPSAEVLGEWLRASISDHWTEEDAQRWWQDHLTSTPEAADEPGEGSPHDTRGLQSQVDAAP